ncbi:MAG: SDR family oxidoreductase [Spirochaetes bacterium]|nr:SDR family oxidoreductase [Spirochaetota bacterium]
MKKVLVLGGSKFIGLRLVEKLVEKQFAVTVFNRGTSNENLPQSVQVIIGDRKNESEVTNLFKDQQYDIVFDTSAYIPADLDPFIQVFSGKIKQYIFCSTVAVYDDEQCLTYPVKPENPCNDVLIENDPSPYPNYGSNKTLCERKLLANKSFPVTIIRPVYIYGPYNYIYREAYFFDRISQGQPILIPGAGYNTAQYIHVDDLAELFIAAIDNQKAFGKAYNAAGPDVVNIRKLPLLIAKIMNKESRVFYYDKKDLSKIFSPEELANYGKSYFPFTTEFTMLYDISPTLRDFQWSPQYDMESGLMQTYKWYLEQDHQLPDFEFEQKMLKFFEEIQ